MHKRQDGRHNFECDECGVDESGEDFMETWERLKEDGWVAIKEGAEWMHFCPECR